jgi:hypothetical protein
MKRTTSPRTLSRRSLKRLVGRLYRCKTPKHGYTNFLRVIAVGRRTVRTQHLLDDLTVPPSEPARGRDSDFRRTYTLNEWDTIILRHWTPNGSGEPPRASR